MLMLSRDIQRIAYVSNYLIKYEDARPMPFYVW